MQPTHRVFARNFRLKLKIVGWWPVLVSAALLSISFILVNRLGFGNLEQSTYLRRAVETVVPLAFAVHAAFLLGPDNEPALELLLSFPRPMPRLFLDRLLLVSGMHLAVALVATLVFTLAGGAETLALAVLRWLAAGIILGGVAVFTTQLTRQSVFGVLMATLLWAASLSGGDGILLSWRWFWPFHVYLQPEKLGMGIYLLNRLVLLAIGLALLLLAMKFLSDDDRMLGMR